MSLRLALVSDIYFPSDSNWGSLDQAVAYLEAELHCQSTFVATQLDPNLIGRDETLVIQPTKPKFEWVSIGMQV